MGVSAALAPTSSARGVLSLVSYRPRAHALRVATAPSPRSRRPHELGSWGPQSRQLPAARACPSRRNRALTPPPPPRARLVGSSVSSATGRSSHALLVATAPSPRRRRPHELGSWGRQSPALWRGGPRRLGQRRSCDWCRMSLRCRDMCVSLAVLGGARRRCSWLDCAPHETSSWGAVRGRRKEERK